MERNVKINVNDIIRKISGIGIISGLEAFVRSDSSVRITEGYGITSTGRLIYCPENAYKYCRLYTEPVIGLTTEQDDIEVWELLCEKGVDGRPLTPQIISNHRFLDSKVALVYFENLAKGDHNVDPDHPPVNQDNFRPLMIDRVDLWRLLQEKFELDPLCLPANLIQPEDVEIITTGLGDPENGVNRFFSVNRNTRLKPVDIMRFGHGTTNNECYPEDRQFNIKSNDFKGVFEEYQLLIDDLLVKLIDNLRILNNIPPGQHNSSHDPVIHFEDLFSLQQRQISDAYLNFLATVRWPKFRDGEIISDTPSHIQYFWSLLKDIAKTYNELVEEISVLMADANLDESLFPFHLLIGELKEDISFGPSIFRNDIRQPAIFNNNAKRLQRIKFLHWRIPMMIKCFYIPGVESNDIADNHYTLILKDLDQDPTEVPDKNIPIRITPSTMESQYLPKKTIPFYYYTAEDSNAILPYWSYSSLFRAKNWNLFSYHSSSEDSYTNLCRIKYPLSHNLDGYPFLRIEGHLGKTLNQVLFGLYNLRKRNNVNFEIATVPLESLFEKQAEDSYSFGFDYLGSNFTGGVPVGGTFIVAYEKIGEDAETGLIENTKVVFDFSVPNRLNQETAKFFIEGITVEVGNVEARIPDVHLRAVPVLGPVTTFDPPITFSNERGNFQFILDEGTFDIQVIDERFEFTESRDVDVNSPSVILELRPVTTTFFLDEVAFIKKMKKLLPGKPEVELGTLYECYRSRFEKFALDLKKLTLPLNIKYSVDSDIALPLAELRKRINYLIAEETTQDPLETLYKKFIDNPSDDATQQGAIALIKELLAKTPPSKEGSSENQGNPLIRQVTEIIIQLFLDRVAFIMDEPDGAIFNQAASYGLTLADELLNSLPPITFDIAGSYDKWKASKNNGGCETNPNFLIGAFEKLYAVDMVLDQEKSVLIRAVAQHQPRKPIGDEAVYSNALGRFRFFVPKGSPHYLQIIDNNYHFDEELVQMNQDRQRVKFNLARIEKDTFVNKQILGELLGDDKRLINNTFEFYKQRYESFATKLNELILTGLRLNAIEPGTTSTPFVTIVDNFNNYIAEIIEQSTSSLGDLESTFVEEDVASSRYSAVKGQLNSEGRISNLYPILEILTKIYLDRAAFEGEDHLPKLIDKLIRLGAEFGQHGLLTISKVMREWNFEVEQRTDEKFLNKFLIIARAEEEGKPDQDLEQAIRLQITAVDTPGTLKPVYTSGGKTEAPETVKEIGMLIDSGEYVINIESETYELVGDPPAISIAREVAAEDKDFPIILQLKRSDSGTATSETEAEADDDAAANSSPTAAPENTATESSEAAGTITTTGSPSVIIADGLNPATSPLTSTPDQDELKLIDGLGAKSVQKLNEKGIRTFEALSQLTAAKLKALLSPKIPPTFDPEGILLQAKLCKDGKWEELKQLKEKLKLKKKKK